MRQRSPKRSVWLYPLGGNLFERSELILLELNEKKGKLTPQHKNMNDVIDTSQAQSLSSGHMLDSTVLLGDLIRFAKIEDLPYIVDLSKKESRSIGFIPKIAYESAITGIKKGKRWSDVCNDRLFVCQNNGDLVGFCLVSFGKMFQNPRKGKIAQICIQTDARKIERGKMLLTQVLVHGVSLGCNDFGCGCADDLESNFFWRAMGWDHFGQRKGISHLNTWKQTSERIINIYGYTHPTQPLLIY